MRKYLLILLFSVPAMLWAGVKVSISDGIDNSSVKTKMETKMSALLTEINAAQANGRALNFSNLNLESSVQQSLSMLWENSPFRCTDDVIVERCLTTNSGYQVRNIPLMMTPKADRNFNESEYQEAVISFDKQGNIESFYLSIAVNLYMQVIQENKEITDLRRRQLILDYVEQFRTAYNIKDINFLNQVFSDDALIITGKVIKQVKDNIPLSDKVIYNKQTKKEYIAKLRDKIFVGNNYVNVTFDNIKVLRHPTDPEVYGVTLHQHWISGNNSTKSQYEDDGYLFLIWDFSNEDYPQILVRTWQPEQINNSKLPENEIFTLDDFDI